VGAGAGDRVRVVLAGGGTGGHLYPALYLADELVRAGADVMLVGARRGLEARVWPARGHPYRLLPVEPLYRRRPWRNLRSAWAFARSAAEAARWLGEWRPDVVVGTGGYAAAPALWAAVRRGIPVVIQEQNAEPGLTTRWFARRARQVHLGAPEARARIRVPPAALVTTYGNPVRVPAERVDRDAARRALGAGPGPLVVAVGGSQGARALNRALLDALARALRGALPSWPEGATLYWSTGPAHHAAVRARLVELGDPGWVRAVPYIDPMETAWAAADLAISRAGAMAVAEMCAWGVPMLLVPFPAAAGDHQRRNAEALAAAGAARWWPEERIAREPDLLWRAAAELLADPDARAAMARAARARGRPDAARRIAGDVLALARASREEADP
jgi:UDP-N-acetylglucosamine--N-acetylmuramyl-(pentapeptide) pyrophosphoryl-undecaprenol N-acetylglucosamine transferase